MKTYKAVVLFDGECNFCNKTVLFIIKYDTNNIFHFASQQSDIGRQLLKDFGYQSKSTQTIILINNKTLHEKTDAIIEISKQLTGFPRILIPLQIIPKKLRDFFYDLFSKYRYSIFGKKTDCEIPANKIRKKFLI
ncbi:thiol-disulfide oxidoreductase DCC family protein [Flavobacterium sp. TBRC 19031]|uniref:thiol-disulfide oxidoreductase DCC family protein n=1 Tax=Flavobacterium mekongense TaxID=3379707 RepID=UPI003999C56B